jgi:CRP/FNR family transcriptional regulator, cyclic AMP receptor protein
MAHAATLSFEDPLTYLPRRPEQMFAKRRIIYDSSQPCDNLYVVILGRVKITMTAGKGFETVSRIVSTDGLFGETALVGLPRRSESAVALDHVSVMAWSRAEIEMQVEREPRLGIALSQYLARQCMELQDRIEGMALYKTPERVMLALWQLASILGTPLTDGTTRMASLTHHTLAEYVGTSREIVTFQLNRLRRLGLVNYTRKVIDIHTAGIEAVLREQNIAMPWSMLGRRA